MWQMAAEKANEIVLRWGKFQLPILYVGQEKENLINLSTFSQFPALPKWDLPLHSGATSFFRTGSFQVNQCETVFIIRLCRYLSPGQIA
ncbi:hypothetical protein XENTR_v10015023 [Xenopus tropicalis]|nr:hypothetical protein XENTR_v10015023 [Xenopus tropicalis]